MPSLSTPPGMPDEVMTVVDALGNHARTQILRILSLQPTTAVELAVELDIAHSSVHRHLEFLEQHGLVETAAEPGRRRGQKSVVWTPVPSRVAEFGRRWIAYASGE